MNSFSWLDKPWLHFILLGVVFFQLQSFMFPEAKPVIGPLSEARIESLKGVWRASSGREPSPEQLIGFVEAEHDRDMLLQRALDRELHLNDSIVYQRLIRNMQFLTLGQGKSDEQLFKQALDMRLHLDDEVVKRRLIQLMEQRLLAMRPPVPPTAQELETAFATKKAELRYPPQYTFEHVFLSANRQAEVLGVGKRILDEGLDIVAARELGSPFLQGYRFNKQTPDLLERNFGRHFVKGLETAYQESNMIMPGWLGPIPSAYGFHYVWVKEFLPARDAEFLEVKPKLLADLAYIANKQALRCAIAELRDEYVIHGRQTIEGGVRVSRIAFLAVTLLSVLFSAQIEAHRFAPSLLKLVETSTHNYQAVWKTPTEATSNVQLQPNWPQECVVTTENPVVREGTGTVSSWSMNCAALGDDGLVGKAIGVNGLAENQASAMVMLSLMDGRSYQAVVNSETPEFRIPGKPSQTKVLTEYSVLGAEHIWEGPDHLMFVFGLLLLVGGGSRLFWTITAFTVGHSVTLALVTLGFLTYPVSLIELAIAISIFVLAIELIRTNAEDVKPSLFKRYPWWLAGGFGLLHGMGFAGALAEIGLPQGSVPLALLAFNAGIEIGQLAFVALVAALWWLLSKGLAKISSAGRLEAWQARWFPVPVYLLGGLSAMWCIERGLEVLG